MIANRHPGVNEKRHEKRHEKRRFSRGEKPAWIAGLVFRID